MLQCDISDKSNNLQVNWGKGSKFHLEDVTSVECSDDPKIEPNPPDAGFDTNNGTGIGRYNGETGAKVQWRFKDAGEPGLDDYAYIRVWDAANNLVLSVSGKLEKGNHQAHRE